MPSDSLAQVNSSVEHAPNCTKQVVCRSMFTDEAICSRPHHALGIERLVIHGEDQHRHARIAHPQILNEFEAVGLLKGQTSENKIRLRARNEIDRATRIIGIAATYQIGLTADEFH